MKLSDYLSERLIEFGVNTVFGYQGSSVSHLIDSISKNPKIEFIETRHEQAAAFAANGYAIAKGDIGVALACSGPGATNLVTGIADAYYDSLPCLFITGQVSIHEMKTDPDMRQLGFQETEICSLVASITKYAVTIKNSKKIAYELEKAIYLMREGRPGPVLIDIPHNIQRDKIEIEYLEHYIAPRKKKDCLDRIINSAISLVNSKRPIILLGGGSRRLKNSKSIEYLIEMNIPIVTSYRGKDIIDHSIKNYCGVLGVYGDRSANWAVKYADYVLVLGSRLDGRQVGGKKDCFAENTKVIVVDIDNVELRNMPDYFMKYNIDVESFLSKYLEHVRRGDKWKKWLDTVWRWRERYPDYQEYKIKSEVNPNYLLNHISEIADIDAVFSVDVGQNQLWANTSLRIKKRQILLQSCGHGAMGFALPAAIGAFYASRTQSVCICGDGGFQMNLQELETARNYRIPIKIVVLNNKSLGLIRVYQDKALSSRRYGSVEGFSSPDYSLLAQAYGFSYKKIEETNCEEELRLIFSSKTPWLIEVSISLESTNYPEPTYLSTLDNQSIEISDEEKERIWKEVYESED